MTNGRSPKQLKQSSAFSHLSEKFLTLSPVPCIKSVYSPSVSEQKQDQLVIIYIGKWEDSLMKTPELTEDDCQASDFKKVLRDEYRTEKFKMQLTSFNLHNVQFFKSLNLISHYK